jgi:acyl-homoserine lactone acylase PvdQ
VLRVAGVLVTAAVLAATASAARPHDYAAVALNVLPPGEAGDISLGRHATDQAKLYDALTPLQGRIKPRALRRYFKSESFGLVGAKPARVERPRSGVRILRDKWDVPHVYGRTRADVMFGDGWATLEDRGLLLALIRGPSALGALDVPGYDPLSVSLSGRQFTPSDQARAFIQQQVSLVRSRGARGRELLGDVNAFLAGMNAYAKKNGTSRWSIVDVIAAGSLIAAAEGVGGGGEVARAEFLDALQRQLGAERGSAVWEDLRERTDPETPTSLTQPFAYRPGRVGAGSVVLKDGTFRPALATPSPPAYRPLPESMSNALLISRFRSKSGHPLFVAGPQVGYFYPELFMEADLHGGGIDARGAVFPGVPYVVIGRAKDYAWSATTSHSDIVDEYAETLCGGDDVHYLYKGECRAMETFDAGTLTNPTQELVFHTTVHGPVIGYAETQDGRRVAISRKRSTYGREAASLFAFSDLDSNRVTSARRFFRVMNQEEFAFNWFYADDRDVALYSAGRLPVRPPGTGDLPVDGDGNYEWSGFEPLRLHAHGTSRTMILNWNNKPAPQYAGSDDRWTWGSIQRVTLLRNALPKRKLTLTDVVSAMNEAATQDLRCELLVPTIVQVLGRADPPSERDAAAAKTLSQWRVHGCDRLDRDLDGRIDDPGAAVMDELWPRVARTVVGDVIGSLTPRLAALVDVDDHASPGGSAWDDGWYGYVDKDLRTLLGEPVRRPFHERYCGRGVLATCAAELWQDVDAAADELAAAQGPDPFAWRASALPERLRFTPGLLSVTMRWTNRPTFQQVVSFDGHRRR